MGLTVLVEAARSSETNPLFRQVNAERVDFVVAAAELSDANPIDTRLLGPFSLLARVS